MVSRSDEWLEYAAEQRADFMDQADDEERRDYLERRRERAASAQARAHRRQVAVRGNDYDRKYEQERSDLW